MYLNIVLIIFGFDIFQNNNIERAIDWLSSHFEDDIELTSDQNTSDKIDEDGKIVL